MKVPTFVTLVCPYCSKVIYLNVVWRRGGGGQTKVIVLDKAPKHECI